MFLMNKSFTLLDLAVALFVYRYIDIELAVSSNNELALIGGVALGMLVANTLWSIATGKS